MRYSAKVRALWISRRFQSAVIGIAVLCLRESFGLDEQTAQHIAMIIVAWIVGDSITKTT